MELLENKMDKINEFDDMDTIDHKKMDKAINDTCLFCGVVAVTILALLIITFL